MDVPDYDEDEVDATCPISPIAPCTPYRESSQKLEIVVRPRQFPMSSPTQQLLEIELLECLITTPILEDQKKKPKKFGVTFHKRVRIQRIRHINDFSQQRVDDIWFTKSEYKNMHAETLATLGLMLTEKPLGEDLTSNGLESKLPAASEQRQKDKLTHLHSVLDEQDQQWASHSDDAQRIASISRTLTAEHRAAARTRGLIVQDTVGQSASKIRKSKSSKMFSSVRKSSSSYHSRRDLLKDVKSKTHHSEHNRTGLQMTLQSAAE